VTQNVLLFDEFRTNIFPQYESSINSYLAKFNAGFRLSSVTSNNTRASSSRTYNVLMNSGEVTVSSDSGPSFRNTLSAGDRNTWALTFFFSSLDQDSRLAQKIVLFDDPMTSLDEHRSLSAIHGIRDLAGRVEQVIVLSHSKPFLAQLCQPILMIPTTVCTERI
jgi:wobble nucleotide-excising tRNase